MLQYNAFAKLLQYLWDSVKTFNSFSGHMLFWKLVGHLQLQWLGQVAVKLN